MMPVIASCRALCRWGVVSLGLAVWAGGGGVQAQTAVEITQLRQDIAEQRRVAEQAYAADQAACYQQFSVSGCLMSARQTRSVIIAELKRQESALNDDDRKRKGAAQLRKMDEKTSAEAEQKAITERAESVQRSQQRLDDKLREQSVTKGVSPGAAPTPKTKNTPAPRTRSTPAPTVHDSAGPLKEFTQKQLDAAQHKADVEKSRGERTKPLAAPLQVHGAEPTPLVKQLAAP